MSQLISATAIAAEAGSTYPFEYYSLLFPMRYRQRFHKIRPENKILYVSKDTQIFSTAAVTIFIKTLINDIRFMKLKEKFKAINSRTLNKRNCIAVKILEMVGAKRFELPTLWSQTRCASQTALRPDIKEI